MTSKRLIEDEMDWKTDWRMDGWINETTDGKPNERKQMDRQIF